MSIKHIIIVLGEPYSTFSEIIGNYLSKKNNLNKSKKITIIGNKELFYNQLKKLNYRINLNDIKDLGQARKSIINFINIEYKHKKIFGKISSLSSIYIEKSFEKSLEMIKKYDGCTLINGPISKKSFLKKKYLGITEYLSKKTKSTGEIMLIYNKNLSVSPLTTHIPLKNVAKNINKKKILNHVIKINNFYKKTLKRNASFAVLGLNPHCESIDNFNEDEKIILPSINEIKKKKIKIKGPFPADTFFLKENFSKFNVVLGMYHDQVLTPIKTLYRFDAVNITLGLPFIRLSPDHGPNFSMLGKNKSDPSSFIYALKFINDLK